MNEEIQLAITEVAARLSDARRVAVLTGAGASAESGVATWNAAMLLSEDLQTAIRSGLTKQPPKFRD